MSKGESTRDKGGKEKEDREGKTASEERTCLGHLSELSVGGTADSSLCHRVFLRGYYS